MKKNNITKYIAGGLAALAMLPMATSCSDYLDKEPDTELTVDMVFENRDKVYSWLANVYDVIHTPDKWALTADGYEVMADDITPSMRWQQWDWRLSIEKLFGQWTINSPWDGNLWAYMPQRIRQGYIFNEKIHELNDGEITKSEIANMKNEVKFLTAYAWWLLAENYGGVPFRPDYIAPTDFNLEELMVGQTPFDEIVNYCDKEMLEAANNLPAIYSDPAKYGRINKIMALTVRSRMLLFAASPLVNGNPWYKDYRNKEGQLIFNPDYDPQKWVKAAEACKLCIDEAEAAGYALYEEKGPDGNTDPFMSTYNVHIKKWSEGNREITFPVTKGNQYQDTFLRVASVRELGGGCGLGVYQGLVDAFFTKNGLPIDDPRSGYDRNTESELSTAVETYETNWEHGTGKSGEITAKGVFNMYCNREPRFYNAVSYNGSWNTVLGRRFDFYWNGKDNIQSDSPHDAPQNGYLVRKSLCMTDSYSPRKVTDRQAFLYRLAFTYLDYAEAVNEAYDDSEHRASALEYLNRIRVRAGIRQYTTAAVTDADPDYIHVDDTQDAIRKVVHMERRVELCVENNRWYDIRRWMAGDAKKLSATNKHVYAYDDAPDLYGLNEGMNVTVEDGRTNKEKLQDQKDGGFTHTKAFCQRVTGWQPARVWKRKYYFFPVYIDEYEKNPNLVQGPFWTTE